MLKRLTAVSSALALLTLVVTGAGAQGPRLDPPPTDEDGDGFVGAAMAMDCPMMGGGARAMGSQRGMGPGPMTGMQGRSMGMGPMGGMMAPGSDPKQAARMMQMRGDMLKAMGEVMLKYGKLLEQSQ